MDGYIGFPTLSTLELELDLGPFIMGKSTILDDAARMNHFPGFEKNWDKPPEGDVDRGKECEDGADEDDDSALS